MVTFDQPQQLGPNTWRLSWSSDQTDPTYRVYLDGQLISEQTSEEYILRMDGSAAPIVEVLDVASDVPADAFPGYLRLGWAAHDDAAQYLVQKYNGASWDTIATFAADASKAWWTYNTPGLADETSHQWRIVPVDAAGNEGTAVSFTVLMVRNPDPPEVNYAYSAGTGKVTIAAA